MFAQISESRIAENAPELVGAAILASLILGGVWKLIDKLQRGNETVVDKFLTHIDQADEKRREADQAQQNVLDRLQLTLDKTTLMLGKTGAALERATHVIERMEKHMDQKAKRDEG